VFVFGLSAKLFPSFDENFYQFFLNLILRDQVIFIETFFFLGGGGKQTFFSYFGLLAETYET